MGKGGRLLCIFTPYVLTIASLICIIMVGLGCTDKKNSTLNDLYFFRANLKHFTASPQTTAEVTNALNQQGINPTSEQLTEVLQRVKDEADIKDFYDIGLWGYCNGDLNNGNAHTTFCSHPEAEFWFNPFKVVGMKDGNMLATLPDGAHKTLDVYKMVSKWMFIAYVVAFALTCAELVVGIFAICSRWGSCVTTLISSVSLLFIIGASATATALYATIKGGFETRLKPYGITGTMGTNMFAATWLAVVFSLAATLFWLISSCCCSGRSPYNHRNRDHRHRDLPEKAPYTYEPIGPNSYGPYGARDTSYPAPPTQSHGNAMPMHNMNTHAYEPFRHV